MEEATLRAIDIKVLLRAHSHPNPPWQGEGRERVEQHIDAPWDVTGIEAAAFIQEGFMRITRFVISMFSVGWMILGANAVSGQDYPAKAIRILTQSVGGNPDFASRLIA